MFNVNLLFLEILENICFSLITLRGKLQGSTQQNEQSMLVLVIKISSENEKRNILFIIQMLENFTIQIMLCSIKLGYYELFSGPYGCNVITDIEKHQALALCLASVYGLGCFLSCLHSVRQTILLVLTNWTETGKETFQKYKNSKLSNWRSK